MIRIQINSSLDITTYEHIQANIIPTLFVYQHNDPIQTSPISWRFDNKSYHTIPILHNNCPFDSAQLVAPFEHSHDYCWRLQQVQHKQQRIYEVNMM